MGRMLSAAKTQGLSNRSWRLKSHSSSGAPKQRRHSAWEDLYHRQILSVHFYLVHIWPAAKNMSFSQKRMAEANRGSRRRSFPQVPRSRGQSQEKTLSCLPKLNKSKLTQCDFTKCVTIAGLSGQLQLAWNRVEWNPFGRISRSKFPATLDRRRAKKFRTGRYII